MRSAAFALPVPPPSPVRDLFGLQSFRGSRHPSPDAKASQGTIPQQAGVSPRGSAPSQESSISAKLVTQMAVDSLKQLEPMREGADLRKYLASFTSTVSKLPMDEDEKILVLGTKLPAMQSGVLLSFGKLTSLGEACQRLMNRLCRESTMAQVDKIDLSTVLQKPGEESFDFYLRLTSLLASIGPVPSDEDLCDLLVPRLRVDVRERLSIYNAENAPLDRTLNVLKIIDKERGPALPSTEKVLVIQSGGKGGHGPQSQSSSSSSSTPRFDGVCHHCGKKGHKRRDCRARKAGRPKVDAGEPERGGKTKGQASKNGGDNASRKRKRKGKGGGNAQKEHKTSSDSSPSSSSSSSSSASGAGGGKKNGNGQKGGAGHNQGRSGTVGSGAGAADAATAALLGGGGD